MLASILFLGTHLGVSSTPIRGMLVKGMGERPYIGVYSVLAAITLGFMIYAYVHVPHDDFVWVPGIAEHAITKALMPFAFILLVAGLMAKNPTAVMSDDAVNQPLAGILKITRHPVQWAILLWGIGHVVANGDMASILFFGTFALLSAIGMAAMDARRRSREEPAWEQFYASTGNVPLVALAAGRTSLKINELNWLAVGIGLVLFVLVYVFHAWIAGVPLY